MIKICILSPGRCGSNFLFNLLLPRYFDNRENLVHTHDEKVAQQLEKENFKIITLRRRNMLDWVLSNRIMNRVPGGIEKEIEYYKSEQVHNMIITKDEYCLRRQQLINHLSLYLSNWPIFYYEDLVENPFKIVSRIFGYPHWKGGSEKLQYKKTEIVTNYNEIESLENQLQQTDPY